ncbi:mucin-12 isoform X10 [Betta splendens]|uniref:Mucin-12 isoform X10 n=1 Tax=Betta splendens TaxID=158456 RepID=A0A9W2X962_BETSP|nr:mucin-12 isoform X10 [Betta splendens]
MQFCRKVLCQPCSARVTSPEEDMEYKMGSCIGISRSQPEEGAPEKVVLFPPQDSPNDSMQAEASAETLLKRDNKSLLTESSTVQQSLQSEPVPPDIPVAEDSGGAGGEQEDKEELEFPHDLLPSLDFSSELDIWESSLGGATQKSSGERKLEQNPLLGGLQHHMDASQPLAPSSRPHTSDPVPTNTPSSPQPTATPRPDVRPPSPAATALLDWELNEAFQECEEQMASLGIFNPSRPPGNAPELAIHEGRLAGEVMVKSSESPSLPPIIAQQGHSNQGHGNRSTHGNSEAANSRKGTVVFSFRDYILGTENRASAAETDSDVKTTLCLGKCPEMILEKETQISEGREAQLQTATNAAGVQEAPQCSSHEPREDEKQHEDSNAITEEAQRYNIAIREKETDKTREPVDDKKENCNDETSNKVYMTQSVMKDGSGTETLGSSHHQAEELTGRGEHNEEADKATKRKHKKKQRKKKTTEDSEARAVTQPVNDELVRSVSTRTDTDAGSVSQADATVIGATRSEDGSDYERQPNPGGKPSSTDPLPPSDSRQDGSSDPPRSPASTRAPPQRPHPSESSGSSPQLQQRAPGAVTDDPNTSTTPALDAQTQAALVSTEAPVLTPGNLSPLTGGQSCVGARCAESGLEEASAALPLTTPTMPGAVESEGEGEGARRDSCESVATAAAGGSEKVAAGEEHLEGSEKCPEREDGLRPLAFICPSADEGPAALEGGRSGKMPHNSAEADAKGAREASICSADAEISPPEEGDGEREPCTGASPPGLLAAPDYRRAAGLQGGGGGGGRLEGSAALATEHSARSQPQGCAGGVSSAGTEARPPIGAAESQLKSRGPTAAFTQSVCLSPACKELPPLPTQAEPSSSSTDGRVRNELRSSLISEEALSPGATCQESSIAETERHHGQVVPSSTAPQPLTHCVQQVQPGISSAEASSAAGPHVPTRDRSAAKNRVHFEDTVKRGDGSMAAPAMDCASLPPLTVHESLHHPVVEASFVFPEFLSPKRSDLPTSAATVRAEAAAQSQKASDGDGLESEDTKESVNTRGDTLKSSLDLQLVTEGSAEQLPCPTGRDHANKDAFVLSHAEGKSVSEANQVLAEVTKREQAEPEERVTSEKELHVFDAEAEGPVENQQPEESPPEDDQHPASSHSALTADEGVTLTSGASLTNSSGNSSPPSTKSAQIPPRGPASTGSTNEEAPATIHFTDLTKDESEASEVTVPDQSISLIEQRASNPAVLQPPGPMLSHVDIIADRRDLSPSEQVDISSAKGDSAEARAEGDSSRSRATSDVSAKADEACRKVDEENDASFKDKEPSPRTHEPAQDASDDISSVCTGIEPVISDVSTGDDLVRVSGPPVPTHLPHDEVNIDNATDRHETGEGESLEEETKRDEGTTANNQKEAANDAKLQSGKAAAAAQHSNGPDKEAVEETGALQPPHDHKEQKTELPSREMREEEERKTASPDKAAGSSEDTLSAEAESAPESRTVYYPSSCQNPVATLESSSDRAPDLSSALGQSRPSTDPDKVSQMQQCPECSGGESRARQTRALVSGIKGEVEGPEFRDESTNEYSRSNERVMEPEEGDGEGAVSGTSRVSAERNPTAHTEIVTAFSHVRETTEGTDENKSLRSQEVGSGTDLLPGAETGSDSGCKGQQTGEDQQRPEISTLTGVCDESTSQQRGTSPLGISVPSEVSADGGGIHLRQPVDVEKECEIQDTVCEPVELQASNKASATQSSPALESHIKGPEVEEITEDDKAALKEHKAEGSAHPDVCPTNTTDEITPLCLEGLASTVPAASAQSEQPEEQVSGSKPLQGVTEHVRVNKEPSESSAVQTNQEPESNWVQALRTAASCSEREQVNAVETSRPLPSLESPQLEFLTTTEERAAPLRQAEVLPLERAAETTTEILTVNRVTQPVDLPDALKTTTQILEAPQEVAELNEPTLCTQQEVPEEPKNPPAGEEEAPVDQLPEPTKKTDTSGGGEEESPWLPEPTSHPITEELPEASEAEVPEPAQTDEPEPADTTEPLESEAERISAAVERLVEIPAQEPVPVPAEEAAVTETLQDSGSSDSDGAFETPESTTPVKAVSPSEHQGLQLIPDDKEDSSVSDFVFDLTSTEAPCRSPSFAFDENKPIAASGTYNIELFSADSNSHTLTRSLSLQGGELDSSGSLDGTTAGGFRPHSESFSVGTESAPGTLRKPKKVRPGSVKKKPLLRQNSNPESPRPASSSSTPETNRRTKARTAQEETEGGGSATPSPGGTLRKNRKSRVETPPPLVEETNHSGQGESLVAPVLPLCQEESPVLSSPTIKDESPIPPCGSYKWDPDNFENINPFKTGGSKIANSPVLGRKEPVCARIPTPPDSPPVPATQLPAPLAEPVTNPEEQPILPNRQPVRLEFDYSEESSEAPHQASPPPKKVGKKPGAKMPLRKPKLGVKKAPPAPVEQLDNDFTRTQNGNEEELSIPTAAYKFEPDKWEDPNFNPFTSKKGLANSPKLSRPSYGFDADNFDDSIDPFKSTIKMTNSPPKASASFDLSNDYDNENDNIGELEDQNQNKPAKKKKTPIKSKSKGVSSLCCLFNTFRVKRSPKKSPLSDQSKDPTSPDEPTSLHQQDDHATDEEKLASSTSHKWAALHDMSADQNSDQPDFPQPSDLTSFVNANSLSHQTEVQDYEIEYMEKIGSSSPPHSVKKPSLYLNLDSVSELTKSTCAHGSEPSSPCTGSFEEMEAQITAGMKTPVLSPRPGPEGPAGDKGRKRESESLSRTQSSERDEQPPGQGPVEAPAPALAIPQLDRLSECDDPLQYMEPDLAETNPTAFAQKLQEELVLAALRIEALQVAKSISQCPSLSNVTPQHRDVLSPVETVMSKNSLYTRSTATAYIEGESPHLPADLDHSLGIAREEIVTKEKEVLEWQKKYEDSRQEVVEMRRIVAEYEKTIAQMIEDDQKEKSLSHHTIQQLIMEKDQALADLNSVEKSLADLFRRYEKMKDVLEGFRKNEDVLKKCAQEYLSRVRKEEQRYQALKIHAEEKLDKANADIAQVRAKAKQEQAAYQASLRKEQMKVDSLERTLEQKNKEIEELTKICDELISKMGKS